ncbi:hypothetical protein HMPREF7215_1456 [Pyramidobacter piscolens W5455]|uniref:Uncharacterized protein n=1 Tax=Pyramidobacter piscolens W5455 TaxID=352165 RepID=A0ABP2HTX4_9BACT|nr:hypothetical protein HMPREF7215_1456 [Pyramidobacter piscolens W5455]
MAYKSLRPTTVIFVRFCSVYVYDDAQKTRRVVVSIQYYLDVLLDEKAFSLYKSSVCCGISRGDFPVKRRRKKD